MYVHVWRLIIFLKETSNAKSGFQRSVVNPFIKALNIDLSVMRVGTFM